MHDGTESFLTSGCLVEFLQGNAWQLAWVMEVQAGKVRLLLPNRRETSMQAARILPWFGPRLSTSDRDEVVRLLQEHTARRIALETEFDALEVWELVHGEMPCATPKWVAELMFNEASEPSADHVAACAHALLQCKTHFKFQTPLFEILAEDVVEKRLVEQEAIQKREALASEGGAFMQALLDVYYKRRPPLSKEELSQTDSNIHKVIHELISSALLSTDGNLNDPAWALLTKSLPEDTCLPIYLAQAWGMIAPHHNIYLDRIGFDAGDTWVKNHTEALCTLQKTIQADTQLPICDTLFVSIDNASTRDIDDAFFVTKHADGGWDVQVALACPAWLWPFDSALDLAVRARATSVYLPEGTYHMLPECLGTSTYSLLAGEERPSLLVTLHVAADGALVSCTPHMARVRLAANLNYAECEPCLDTKHPDFNLAGMNPLLKPHLESLQAALALAQCFQKKRLQAGAVIIEKPEPEFKLTTIDGEVHVSLEFEEPSPCAHTLVSEMMLLTNASLANWAQGLCGTEAVPFVYRNQHVQVPEACQGIWREPLEIALAVKALAPALFSTSPLPHGGIGVSAYALCTSPLRRYMDYLNNAQIISIVQTGTPRWNNEELYALVGEVQSSLSEVSQMQRFRNRYWKLLYLQQADPQQWWPAVVTDITTFVSAMLVREQVLVRAKRALWPAELVLGQSVELRLRVDALHNDLYILEVRP